MMKEYRICELCEHKNDVSFLVCEKCDADLSFISPQFIQEESTETNEQLEQEETEETKKTPAQPDSRVTMTMEKLVLVDEEGNQFELPFTETSIGREGNFYPDYFNKSTFVSRNHAKIIFDGFQHKVIDVGSHNGSILNGQRLVPNEEYPLEEGGEIIFADLKFSLQYKKG